MSSDFVSWVSWLRPRVAQRLFDVASDSEDPPVVGADGAVVFQPGADRPFLPKTVARAVGKKLPSREQLKIPASGNGVLSEAGEEGVDSARSGIFVSSSRFALLPLVDRLIAIPHGVRFLEGGACARMRPKRRARFAEEWTELVEMLGGTRKIARTLAPYIDSGGDPEEEAREVLRAITTGLRKCEARGRDLFLVGVVAPR